MSRRRYNLPLRDWSIAISDLGPARALEFGRGAGYSYKELACMTERAPKVSLADREEVARLINQHYNGQIDAFPGELLN